MIETLDKVDDLDSFSKSLMYKFIFEYKTDMLDDFVSLGAVSKVENILYHIGRGLSSDVTCCVRKVNSNSINAQYSVYRKGSVILTVVFDKHRLSIQTSINRVGGKGHIISLEGYIAMLLKDLYGDDSDMCEIAYKGFKHIKDKFDFSMPQVNRNVGLDALKFGSSQYSENILSFSNRVEPMCTEDEVIDFINGIVWNFHGSVVWSYKDQMFVEE